MPDRPRRGVAATTGQHPVARTRETGAGPHGTAQIPVIRAAPRTPEQPSTDGRVQPLPVAPLDPSRRRLRALPPEVAEPRTAPMPVVAAAPARHFAPPAPTAPASRSGRRSTARPLDRAASPAPRPTNRTAPPPPSPPVVEPVTDRRHPIRVAFSLLAVAGMVAISGLPSIGAETGGAPPVAGVHLGDDLQQFRVADDVTAADAGTDLVSGTLPVVAPGWVLPLQGELRDGFGPRLAQPVAGVSLFHRGQDVGGGCGTPIHAAAAGRVETAQWWGTYGNWVLIDHGDGVETGYAHQQRMVVAAGQVVKAGQVIGYEGNTGASTGCHLHVEVHLDGVAVNPVPFFAAKGVPLG